MLDFEEFCGGKLWDPNITIDTEDPEFTPCFESTILSWIPLGFFLLFSPFLIRNVRQMPLIALPWRPLLILKMMTAMTAVFAMSSIVTARIVSYDMAVSVNDTLTYAELISVIADWLLIILVFISMGLCRKRGINSSGVIFLTLVLMVICGVVKYRTSLRNFARYTNDSRGIVIFVLASQTLYISAIVFLLILSCFADKISAKSFDGSSQPSPKMFASFLNRLTFSYFLPICITGFRRSLDVNDLWDLESHEKTSMLSTLWNAVWAPKIRTYQIARKKAIDDHKRNISTENINIQSQNPLLADLNLDEQLTRNNNPEAIEGEYPQAQPDPASLPPRIRVKFPSDNNRTCSEQISPKLPPKPSILVTLFQCSWKVIIVCIFLNILEDALMFVNPQLLEGLIGYMQDPEEPGWHGYLFACGILVFSCLSTLLNHSYMYLMFKLSMRVDVWLTDAVYRKTLRLSNSSKRNYTSGEIVNIMSVDVDRVSSEVPWITSMWSCPINIGLALYFLYQQLGASVFAGLGVLLVAMPLNTFIFYGMEKNQVKLMEVKDERLKMLTEVLNSLKILKLYAWEPSFEELISEIRQREVGTIRTYSCYDASFQATWEGAPFLMTAVSFATYVLTDPENHVLTPQTAFVSLALFNLLVVPMGALPMMLSSMVQLWVSSKRIQKFLLADEIDDMIVDKIIQPISDEDQAEGAVSSSSATQNLLVQKQHAIDIKNGTFSWAGKEPKEEDDDDEDDNNDDEVINGDKIELSNDMHMPSETVVSPIPTLRNINVAIARSSLTAIVGRVGEGKSSLINAILGEMNKEEGDIIIRGSIAYVPQQAWIQNMTIRDNIIFSETFDDIRYQTVVNACALDQDFDILPAGDLTEIGEKGVNLSGGQKQRVSLARAVYQQADIYLFDDPLSAVDAHVGRHIFNEVMGPNGLLRNTTRLLVTHGLSYLCDADQIIVMIQGEISEVGSYAELLERGGAFSEIIISFENDKCDNEDSNKKLKKTKSRTNSAKPDFLRSASHQPHRISGSPPLQSVLKNPRRRLNSTGTGSTVLQTMKGSPNLQSFPARPKRLHRSLSANFDDESIKQEILDDDARAKFASSVDECELQRETSERQVSARSPTPPDGGDQTDRGRLIKDEEAESGNVKAAVYWEYIRALGPTAFVSIMTCYCIGNGMKVVTNLWLTAWSNEDPSENSTSISVQERLGVYTGLGMGYSVSLLIAAMLTAYFGVQAAKRLHLYLLHSILRAPMAFFDVTPMGRILNRFGGDVNRMDTALPENFRELLQGAVDVLANAVIIIVATPLFAVVIFPLAILYFALQRVYIASSRQLTRLQSVTESPVISHFQETVHGAVSIRAFGAQERFITTSGKHVDLCMRAYLMDIVANQFIGVYLQLIGNVVTFFAAIFAVASRGTLSAGLAGLSVTYAMNITSLLEWSARMMNDIETNIVSVERIKDYTNTTPEAEWHIEETKPRPDWPDEGSISFENLFVRYREGLDLVLRDLNCSIEPMEKIGIVGRTGAGKSSLTLSLFRLVEPASGRIVIDGCDISTLGLHHLRSQLNIIPQDPVLFTGTLQLNLDPLNKSSEEDIWCALEHAHLADFIRTLPDGLKHTVSEGGENLSVGQRQLICLARALLHKTKILILDEATAAVDMETDSLIQQTIRSEFAECTVLTIAHRLNTVMDSSRIMVLQDGRLKEFDTPEALLADRGSLFFGMAREANLD